MAALLMLVGMNESYAQSQYRRQSGNSQRNNSEYRPAQKQQSAAAKPQQSKPAQSVNRPQQNNKPAQSVNRPQQNANKPQQSKPAQSVNRPQQSNRPAPSVNRPQSVNRPTQNVNRPQPSSRPNVAPPVNHYRPEPPKHAHNVPHMRPRPSVHFYGYYTKVLPVGAKIIHRGPYDYYYADGRYYRYINNVYVISRPPVGAIIAKSVLNGLLRLTDYVIKDALGRTQRYYTDDDGVYYVKSNNNYIVVDPPVGAIVYELPYGFEVVTINGTKYYQVDDNFYELVYNGPQDYYFRVVGTLGR